MYVLALHIGNLTNHLLKLENIRGTTHCSKAQKGPGGR